MYLLLLKIMTTKVLSCNSCTHVIYDRFVFSVAIRLRELFLLFFCNPFFVTLSLAMMLNASFFISSAAKSASSPDSETGCPISPRPGTIFLSSAKNSSSTMEFGWLANKSAPPTTSKASTDCGKTTPFKTFSRRLIFEIGFSIVLLVLLFLGAAGWSISFSSDFLFPSISLSSKSRNSFAFVSAMMNDAS